MTTNTHTTAAGKVGPVCEACGRRGRAVPTDDGRVTLWDLGRGWSTAPYPPSYVHPDGSTGSRFTCPDCNGARGDQKIPPRTWSAPHDRDALPELAAATATAEIAWVAREARALRGSDDEQRRARFMARKAALLAYIEATTGGGGSCS